MSDKITVTNIRTGESFEMDAPDAINFAAQHLLLAQIALNSAQVETAAIKDDGTATVTYSWPVVPAPTPPPSTAAPSFIASTAGANSPQ